MIEKLVQITRIQQQIQAKVPQNSDLKNQQPEVSKLKAHFEPQKNNLHLHLPIKFYLDSLLAITIIFEDKS